jgi:hypothetical protein
MDNALGEARCQACGLGVFRGTRFRRKNSFGRKEEGVEPKTEPIITIYTMIVVF